MKKRSGSKYFTNNALKFKFGTIKFNIKLFTKIYLELHRLLTKDFFLLTINSSKLPSVTKENNIFGNFQYLTQIFF